VSLKALWNGVLQEVTGVLNATILSYDRTAPYPRLWAQGWKNNAEVDDKWSVIMHKVTKTGYFTLLFRQ